MLAYAIRRLLYMIPTLLGVITLTFFLFNVVGGNPAYQLAGKNATAEQIAEIEKQLGLDKPLHLQYVSFVKDVVTLNFGRSWSTKQKISTMISDGVGASLSLAVPPFVISLLLSISLALLLTYYHGRLLDKSVMAICIAMLSISSLVYIIYFQYLLAYQLGWFPISGWDSSWTGRWKYVALPGLIWVILSQGSAILLYRTVMMDEATRDYVRTARAKGLGYRIIYFKHILKNAMIPIITVVVMEMPFLFTGSLLLENFFSIPGLGGMLVQAIFNSDLPVIKAMTVIGSILYMIFNLISDICYGLVDPRVSLK